MHIVFALPSLIDTDIPTDVLFFSSPDASDIYRRVRVYRVVSLVLFVICVLLLIVVLVLFIKCKYDHLEQLVTFEIILSY